MKKNFNWLICVPFLGILLLVCKVNKTYAQDVTVSYQNFYDNLAPYGQWVYDSRWGNVFVPYEDSDPNFRPYFTRGHWLMTEYGNTWVSDDPWGWACYHYGRWTYNNYYGWVWIPGYQWAPAWVSWRYGNGYAGWAPLGPDYDVNGYYNCPENWWVFLAPNYLYHERWHDYYEGYGRNSFYIRRTSFMNNYNEYEGGHVYYNYGPRAEVIERTTHQPIQVFRTSSSNRPGVTEVNNRNVNIYRPNVQQNNGNARPANVIQAPHAIGRPESHGNTNVPAFHQENPRPSGQNNNPQQPAPQQHQQQPMPQQQRQPEPQQHQQQPVPQQHQQQPMPQQQRQPEPPQRQQPQPQRQPEPPQRQQPQPMPQQHQQQPMPQRQPQQRSQPAPQHQQPAQGHREEKKK